MILINAFSMFDKTKIEELPLSVQKEKAFNKVLRCVSASEQSSLKVRSKLESQGYCIEAVEYALDRAISSGFIDDSRYAECLVRQTLMTGKGFRSVRSELEKLDIDLDEVEAYQEYLLEGEEAEVSRAVAYLQAHPSRSKNLYQSCYRKLINKGYEGDTIHKAIRAYMASLEEDA